MPDHLRDPWNPSPVVVPEVAPGLTGQETG